MGDLHSKIRGELVFALNGEEVRLNASDVDPTMTLNEYLRTKAGLTGTKLSCGEGGCGACAVDVARWDAVLGKAVHVSVNSCLRPLASLDGCSITTVEGLGSTERKEGLHPIQERMAGFNASQCGFCTPGMTMTIYSTIKGREAAGGDLTPEEVESKLDGNICRCTGYRPILDAGKSFAKEHDIEDTVCGTQKELGPYDPARDPAFPDFLKELRGADSRRLVCKAPTGDVWVRPASLKEALAALDQFPDGEGQVVVARTSLGIYKKSRKKYALDLTHVPELNAIATDDEAGLTVGASTTVSRFHEALLRVAGEQRAAGKGDKVASFDALAAHAWRVANVHVRNVGSVAGNLVMAKRHGFLSDLATILLGAGATVHLATKGIFGVQKKSVTMEEFLASPDFESEKQIVHSITVPWTRAGDHYNSYKTALRPENSHAYINAAFRFNVSPSTGLIEEAVCAFGGVKPEDVPGNHALRAKETEAFLVGKKVSNETLSKAVKVLRKEMVVQAHSHGKREYRHRLLSGFFYKFFASVVVAAKKNRDAEEGEAKDAAADGADAEEKRVVGSATAGYIYQQRGVTKGSQAFTYAGDEKNEELPVFKPVEKISAKVQTTGQAVYTDDMPTLKGTVFGAFVPSAHAAAKIGGLANKEEVLARKDLGVVAILTAEDIPGKNNLAALPFNGDVPLLATDRVNFWGQPVALVLADSTRHANEAAQLVEVKYDEVEVPVLTVAQALAHEDEAKYRTPVKNETKCGEEITDDILAADEHKMEGTVSVGSQLHFYMEPLVAYAWTDEDHQVVVHCANQWPDAVNVAVSNVLSLPHNQVKIVHRRAGGGFGGKLSHASIPSAAAALAAFVLKRPVRMTLGRNVDMAVAGGREECQTSFKAAFNSKGVLSALDVSSTLGMGASVGLSWFTNMSVAGAVNQCYGIPNFRSQSTLVRTNKSVRTAVRGPGEIEAIWIVEEVIERIAAKLGLDPVVVRERNFYPAEAGEEVKSPSGVPIAPFTVPAMWARAKEKHDFDARSAAVAAFNKENRWRKRGISMLPVRYQVGVWAKSALVNVYGDGTVLITHGGSEMGQGLNTKVAQVAAYELGKLMGGKPLDMSSIRFADMSSHVTPNATFTGGSTGSEGTAEAVRRCCATIVGRLTPVKEGVEMMALAAEDGDEPPAPVTWQSVVGAAKGANVNLSAQDHWQSQGEDTLHYHNYGCAIAEVELDVLTGESNVVRVDLVYDCGKSLNPAIDIGQVEGALQMGLGLVFREDVLYSGDGELLANGTWEYKPPGVRDIPCSLNVELLQSPGFERGILSSKSSGEPPLCLAAAAGTAMRQAVASARRDAKVPNAAEFDMPLPLTVDVIHALCCVTDAQLQLREPTEEELKQAEAEAEVKAEVKAEAEAVKMEEEVKDVVEKEEEVKEEDEEAEKAKEAEEQAMKAEADAESGVKKAGEGGNDAAEEAKVVEDAAEAEE